MEPIKPKAITWPLTSNALWHKKRRSGLGVDLANTAMPAMEGTARSKNRLMATFKIDFETLPMFMKDVLTSMTAFFIFSLFIISTPLITLK